MKCSVGKLLWTSLQGRPCEGSCQIIGDILDIKNSVQTLLTNNKCLGERNNQSQYISKSDLLANRLSPYNLDKKILHSLDICQYHFVSILNFQIDYLLIRIVLTGIFDNSQSSL